MNIENVTLHTAAGDLFGTLELPSQTPSLCVALIVAGSGPTDRDGNNPLLPGKNDSLKMLAAALTDRGVASLRYDKRGIAASKEALQDEAALRFEDMIEDAVSWLKLLQGDPRFDQIILIGHSEGSLIGIAAAQEAGIDGFISLEGTGYSAQETIMTQFSAQLPPSLLAEVQGVIDKLVAGSEVQPIPESFSQIPTLVALFRASVQPYLISWFRYDPAQLLAALTIPILIVQGTADLQVSINDARRLAAANASARLAVIEDMNHVLKIVPANDQQANLAAYSDPGLPLAGELIESIAAFVQRLA